jgi:hypothetical protein
MITNFGDPRQMLDLAKINHDLEQEVLANYLFAGTFLFS